MRTLRSQSNFHCIQPPVLTIVTRLHTSWNPGTYSSCNWKFVPFGHHLASSPPSSPLENIYCVYLSSCLVSSNQSLLFCLWSLGARSFHPGNSCSCLKRSSLVFRKSQIPPWEFKEKGRDEPLGRPLWTPQNPKDYNLWYRAARHLL